MKLPRIDYSSYEALELMGCTVRGCDVESYFDIKDLVRVLKHNGEVDSFPHEVTSQGNMVGKFDDLMRFRPLVPRPIAMWVEKRHEIERQAAIDADPWLQHADAVMLGRSKTA